MKKWIATLLIAALFCPLVGCSKTEDNTIWVVTEETSWDQMNGQTQAVINAFAKEHPNVTIRLDILPTEEKERAAYLQQLRTQILQGGGPDAYLLPTDNLLTTDTRQIYVEPLFADVMLAMKNGIFQDISALYDADDQLGKDALNTTIMDAGMLDGNRYVLPLRYDIPVIYAETAPLEEVGFDLSSLNQSLPVIMQAALSTGNAYVAAGGVFASSAAFSSWIDYAASDVTLDSAQLAAYMQLYRQLVANTQYGGSGSMNVRSYVVGTYDKFEGITGENTYSGLRWPLFIGSLNKLLEYAPISQYEEGSYTILPLQSDANGSVATVTYYAAIGSGCRNPELVYQFLRQFLLEESQWEANRPTKANIIVTTPGSPPRPTDQDTSKKSQRPGLIGNGWPVRSQGSLAPLWEVRRKQFYTNQLSTPDRVRFRQIGLKPLNEEFAEILDAPISQVRFPSSMDTALSDALASLNDYDGDFAPTDASIDDLVARFLWDMRLHVSEG